MGVAFLGSSGGEGVFLSGLVPEGYIKWKATALQSAGKKKGITALIFSKFLAIMFGGAISHDAPTGLSLDLRIISRWKKQLELICPMAAP